MLSTLALTLLSYNALFDPPFRIMADKQYINVDSGHVAPLFDDIDGDGLKELVVGQFDGGKLRIYKNYGTNSAPAFKTFEWFYAGGKIASVPSGCCVGFVPHLADLDGDGTKDLFSGSRPGKFYIFRGLGKGQFAEPTTMVYEDGKVINQHVNEGMCAVATAVDWNDDGILDIVSYSSEPGIQLFPSRTPMSLFLGKGKLKFAHPISIMAGDPPKPLSTVPSSIQAFTEGKGMGLQVRQGRPTFADWDGDGIVDLVLGRGNGSISFFKGVRHIVGSYKMTKSTRGLLSLFKEQVLIPAINDEVAPDCTSRSANIPTPCVTDWNGDGKADLLVGDLLTRRQKGNKDQQSGHIWVYLRK